MAQTHPTPPAGGSSASQRLAALASRLAPERQAELQSRIEESLRTRRDTFVREAPVRPTMVPPATLVPTPPPPADAPPTPDATPEGDAPLEAATDPVEPASRPQPPVRLSLPHPSAAAPWLTPRPAPTPETPGLTATDWQPTPDAPETPAAPAPWRAAPSAPAPRSLAGSAPKHGTVVALADLRARRTDLTSAPHTALAPRTAPGERGGSTLVPTGRREVVDAEFAFHLDETPACELPAPDPDERPLPRNRALEVSPGRHGLPAALPSEGRATLLRDVRRAWMGAAFKQTPHSVLVVSLRLARVPGANAPAAEALLARTAAGLTEALETVGPVYSLGPCRAAVLLKDSNLRQTVRIGEAVSAAIAKRAEANPLSPLLVAAGAAALHRDDDPAAIVCLAEECLELAETADTSRVVAESDPEVRMRPKSRRR